MNRVTVRGFQTTAQRAINYIGSVTLADVVDQNGPEWGDPVNDACLDVEKKYPKVTDAKIQGAKAHVSAKDKEETQQVVTVGFYSAQGTRLLSGHIRKDGTYKIWTSRAGRNL